MSSLAPHAVVFRMRSNVLALLSMALLCAFASPARAEWPTTGVSLPGTGLLSLASDDAGGVFVVASGAPATVYRLAADGTVPSGWTTSGVSLGPIAVIGAARDGSQGLYLLSTVETIEDGGSGPVYRSRQYTHRLGPDGVAPLGWPLAGTLVRNMTYERAVAPGVGVDDGAGGAFFTWRVTYPDEPAGYLNFGGLHLKGDGSVVGKVLSSTHGIYRSYSFLRDGQGGMIAVAAGDNDMHLQRLRPDDGADGVFTLTSNWQTPSWAGAVPIGANGDLLAWWLRRPFNEPDTTTYRLVRVSAAMQPAAGWNATGIACTNAPIAGDGAGGAYFAIDDAGTPRLQRVSFASMSPTVLWGPAGAPIAHGGMTAGDGSGGLFQVWLEGATLKALHSTAGGAIAPGWGTDGVVLATNASFTMRLIEAGAGRAIVAWQDADVPGSTIHVQLLADDSPVPTSAAFVGITSLPHGARLDWSVTAPGSDPFVERGTDGVTWSRIGQAVSTTGERWTYEDADVHAGESWYYRLVRSTGVVPGSQARVTIPGRTNFALRGFVENPAIHAAVVEFTLPDAAPARLEALDLAGRVLWRREVGALGAGTHRVALDEPASAPSGVRFLQLTRAGDVVRSRGVRVR